METMEKDMTVDELCEYTNRLEELIVSASKAMEGVLEDYAVKAFDTFLETPEVRIIRSVYP